MKTTKKIGARKGITPVVAIVLLLMLTIVAVGGMWAWTSDILTQQQDEAEGQLRAGIEFISLSCDAASDELSWTIKNTGRSDIDLSDVDVYVYEVSNNELFHHTTENRANPLTTTDRHWYRGINGEPPVAIANNLAVGTYYEVVVEPATAQVSASQECQAE